MRTPLFNANKTNLNKLFFFKIPLNSFKKNFIISINNMSVYINFFFYSSFFFYKNHWFDKFTVNFHKNQNSYKIDFCKKYYFNNCATGVIYNISLNSYSPAFIKNNKNFVFKPFFKTFLILNNFTHFCFLFNFFKTNFTLNNLLNNFFLFYTFNTSFKDIFFIFNIKHLTIKNSKFFHLKSLRTSSNLTLLNFNTLV